MKRSLISLAILAGCGVSDPSSWEKCASCAADPNGLWNVIADGAETHGGGDFLGPVDPYLCLSISGTTRCSSHVSDTREPRFNDTLFTSKRVSDLVNRSFGWALWDKDTGGLDPNDSICSGTTSFSTEDLAEGGKIVSCADSRASFRFEYVGSN